MTSTIPRRSKECLALALLIAGVWRFPCDDVRLSFEMLVGIAATIGVATLAWRVNRWVAMFLTLAAISAYYPCYTRYSHLAFQSVFFGVAWFAALAYCLEGKDTGALMDAMCIIALCHVAFLVLQHFNLDPMFTPHDPRTKGDVLVGLMTNPNEVSALLAFCLPAFCRAKWWWLIPAVVLGLVICASCGGLIAAGAGIMAVSLFALPGSTAVVVVGAIVAAMVAYSLVVDNPLDGLGVRLETWKRGGELYKQHWIMGAGLGHWKLVFRHVDLSNHLWWKQAHNEYLQAIFEMGIAALGIFAGYAASVVRRMREAKLAAMALVIIAVNCLVNFPFHIGVTALVAITWMAIFEIQTREEAA